MFLPVLAFSAAHFAADAFDAGPNPLLLKHPTVNRTQVVFEFAGDIWSASRSGGDAVRLTATGGTNSQPFFSPDGTQIAFTGNYDGNIDVFVMPANGGNPRRLTAHPHPDMAVGWTPDGKSVLFTSTMLSNTDYWRLYSVPTGGGVPKSLPFPAVMQASMSADGQHLAYVPNPKWQQSWKRYRGGQTTPIWIGDLATSKVHEIPRSNTNDSCPMWIGDSIYYLSDPTGPVGLSKFDTKTGKESIVIPGSGFDLKSATEGDGVIAYEKLGSIHLYDPVSGADHPVSIRIRGDFPATRPQIKDLRRSILSLSLSPTGKRAVVAARGWILTAPASKGDIRLLDERQGIDRTEPAWSPDGKTLAFMSEDSHGQHLSLYDLATNKEREVALPDGPAYYGSTTWSPDSSKIAFTDNRLNLWLLDVATGKSIKIDAGIYRGTANISPNWSPDSKWITWARDLPNFVTVVFVYSVDSGKTTQVTNGLANASLPVFDRGGKYLYFAASTNLGFGMDFEDLQSMAVTNFTSHLYALLLRKDVANPLQPESDEEKQSAKKDEAKKAEPKFTIDLDGIQRRVVSLPIPEASYSALTAGPDGSFFVLSNPPRATPVDNPGPGSILKFSFSDRKATPFGDGVNSIDTSADGSKLLIGQGGTWRIVGTDGPPPPGSGTLDLDQLKAKVDPVTEWRAMYHQVWRKERALFYDPGLHGADADVLEKRYEPFLSGIRSRDDLNYLFTDMLGELCIGHMFIGGGDSSRPKFVPGGLLGADFALDHGRYRITRVYDGETWNPDLASPLGAAGVNAQAGEYLLAIDGKTIDEANDIYLYLEGKAGKQVTVTLGPSPDGKDSRDATVVPVADESDLRNRAWEEDCRRYVEKETGGRAGYVHVPDTGGGGWIAFMRYYYTQVDKQGMIIDDRFNHGGYINDFMVREMEKPLDFYGGTRYGANFKVPLAAVYGPKVMLINEMAGSGGDLFPYLFRSHNIGKLVGHKTWGGELSAYGFRVIDGGSVRAPDDAQWDPITGQYVIDNEGVAPDISVELDPEQWRNGVDAQLKAAVEELKRQMDAHPPVPYKRPPYPNKSKLK